MSAHYVYRCYAADGRLLYVGASADVPSRLRQHADRTVWARDVVKVRAVVFPSKAVARAVERQAIRTENPRYNVMGRWQLHATWTLEEFDEYLDALRVLPTPEAFGRRRHLDRVLAVRSQIASRSVRAAA